MEWRKWHKKAQEKKYCSDKIIEAVTRWIDELDKIEDRKDGLDYRIIAISSLQMVLGPEEETKQRQGIKLQKFPLETKTNKEKFGYSDREWE